MQSSNLHEPYMSTKATIALVVSSRSGSLSLASSLLQKANPSVEVTWLPVTHTRTHNYTALCRLSNVNGNHSNKASTQSGAYHNWATAYLHFLWTSNLQRTVEACFLVRMHFFCQAFAEMLHETVRKEVWGYADDEALTAAELHKIKYEVSWL